MAEASEATLVVVTWNSATCIGPFLDSVAASDPAQHHEVVIVDNDSSDETISIAAAHEARPTIIRNASNRGLAAANNQGMAASRGEFIVICNPDVILGEGCVSSLVDCARRHPRAAFVIARLTHEDGRLQPGVGDLPRLGETLLGRRVALTRHRTSGIWWDGWDHDHERQVGHGQEACYLVRPQAVDEVGAQDERYVLDWEGLDWSDRMGRRSWEIWFCPSATAVHLGGVSVRQAQTRWVIQSHRGMYRYFADRSARGLRPLLAFIFGLRALVRLGALAVRGNTYRRIESPG
jgi:GT2 family glycosyltransferase